MMRKLFALLSMVISFVCSAQVEMADDFRGEGKIYVVVAVFVLLLAGFFFLIFRLDKKVKSIEEEVKGGNTE